MIKILFILLFTTVSLSDLAVIQSGKPVVNNPKTGLLMQQIIDAYDDYGVSGVDAILDSHNTDWYNGLDLYMNKTDKGALQMMLNDEDAYYHNADSITVKAESTGEYSVIVITSY